MDYSSLVRFFIVHIYLVFGENTAIKLLSYFDDYSSKINSVDLHYDTIKMKDGYLGIGIPYNIHVRIFVIPFIEDIKLVEEDRSYTEEEKWKEGKN